MEVYTSVLFLSLIAAGVMGEMAVPQEDDIRLVTTDTATRAGRVEVFHGGRWGSVCNQGFEMEDAKVVCRQWGYPAGVYSMNYYESRYGQGQGPFMLSNVRCIGTESKLTDCPADPWEQNQCTHSQEAAVMCRGKRTVLTNAARRLYDMIEQLEDEAYAEKEEDFFQNLKEDEAYAEKEEDFFQNLKEDEAYAEKEEDFFQNLKEDEAYAEKEEDFFQNLKEDEAYAEKEEDFFQNLKHYNCLYQQEDEAYQVKRELELVAEILAQLEDN